MKSTHAFFIVLSIMFFCSGCPYVESIDLDHGFGGDAGYGTEITVTLDRDGFNCNNDNYIHFHNSVSGNDIAVDDIDCLSDRIAVFRVPENLPDLDQGKTFWVTYDGNREPEEDELFYLDICLHTYDDSTMTQPERDGKLYLDQYLIEPLEHGVYCTAQPNVTPEPWDVGSCLNHEFGSERQSIAMLYYTLTGTQGDCQQYIKVRNSMVEHFMSDYDLLYWRLDNTYNATPGYGFEDPTQPQWWDSSASIDDLRAIQALFLAHERFGTPYDLHLAEKMLEANFAYSTHYRPTFGEYLTSGADWSENPSNPYSPYPMPWLHLNYSNLPVMEEGIPYVAGWSMALSNTLTLLLGATGSVNPDLVDGIFWERYDFDTGYPYYTAIYDYDTTIVQVNSTWQAKTGLYLVEYFPGVSYQNLEFWMDKWSLYGRIDGSFYLNGNPVVPDSADISVYALIARMAKRLDELGYTNSFEDTMINAILPYQTTSGAFAMDPANRISSWQHILSLLALAYQRQ